MNIQKNNPLHGVKLEQIIIELKERYGWEYLGYTINIRCFNNDPSVKSSLKFLRRTPWARKKVEDFYVKMLSKKNSESYKICCFFFDLYKEFTSV